MGSVRINHSPCPVSLLAPVIIGGLIAAGGAIAGGLMGKSSPAEARNPYEDSPYGRWLSKHGPGVWNQQLSYATNMLDNPYGLGRGAKTAMARNMRNTAGAGYGASQRQIASQRGLSGLSGGGGDASRRQYLSGQNYASQIGRGLNQIEVLDAMKMDEQRARAENMLMNIGKESPAYSQIASQNYWNMMNYNQAQDQATMMGIGQMAGYGADMYTASQQNNPYTNNYAYGGSGYSPGGYGGTPTDNSAGGTTMGNQGFA